MHHYEFITKAGKKHGITIVHNTSNTCLEISFDPGPDDLDWHDQHDVDFRADIEQVINVAVESMGDTIDKVFFFINETNPSRRKLQETIARQTTYWLKGWWLTGMDYGTGTDPYRKKFKSTRSMYD
jgi:hypothetical protein